jgi:hypothetical protein
VVEDVACESSFDRLRIRVTRPQPIAKDHLVAEEGVLGTGLAMVTGFLLPLPSTDLPNAADHTISRPTSTPSDLCGLNRWDDDLCATTGGSVVERPGVVGTIAKDSTDLVRHALDKFDTHAGVIDTRVSQHLTDDHASLIDTEMQLLPAANALAAVFGRSPLAFPEDG